MQWSLEDIYKKQVRGRIPPRKHLRVLGEVTRGKKPTETVQTVLPGMGDDAGAKHHVPQSDKDWAGVPYVPAKDPSTMDKLLDAAGRALGLDKLQSGDMRAVDSIRTITQDYVGGGEMDEETIQETLAILNDLSKYKVSAPLPKNQKFNWIDFITKNHPSKYIGTHASDFITKLSKLAGSGSVSVGWPEFAGILFLSNTGKSKSGGDLERDGELLEVKATEARMGTGNPENALREIKDILEKNGIEYEETGSGSKTVWKTLRHSLWKVEDSDLSDDIKRNATLDLLINGTPKQTVYSHGAETFIDWAKDKDIVKLVEDENILKYIYAALQILFYWNDDGHRFNSMWAVNNNLDSFVFDITEDTTFEDVFNILRDNFVVSKVESDSFYGPVGITVQSQEAQDVLKIK